MKWCSIPLLVKDILKNKMKLSDKLFRNPIEATQKFDGTNVGKDSDGNMYGRNKMIGSQTETYQKMSLHGVKKIDVKPVRNAISKAV